MQHQYQAYRAVNKELITIYEGMSKSIAEKQEKFDGGQKI